MKISVIQNAVGRQTVKVGDDISIQYNRDQPYMIDIYTEHAKKHGGRLLVPFGSKLTLKSILLCRKFVMVTATGEYLLGDLESAGDRYTRTLDEKAPDGYSAPETLVYPMGYKWVRLSNVYRGENFDEENYLLENYDEFGNVTSLSDVMASARAPMMLVRRKTGRPFQNDKEE